MQCDWVYNCVGFIGPYPSQHSRRMCIPYQLCFQKWGIRAQKYYGKPENEVRPLKTLSTTMTNELSLAARVWAVSRSALAPGAVLPGFSSPVASYTDSHWFYRGELNPAICRWADECFLQGLAILLQVLPVDCNWWEWMTETPHFSKGGFVMAPKPRLHPAMAPGTWPALLGEIPVS